MNLVIIVSIVVVTILIFIGSVLSFLGNIDEEEEKIMTVEDITDRPKELTEYQEECLRQSVNAFTKG